MTSHVHYFFPTVVALVIGSTSAIVEGAAKGDLVLRYCFGDGFCAGKCQDISTTVDTCFKGNSTHPGSMKASCDSRHDRSCGKVLVASTSGKKEVRSEECSPVMSETAYVCGECMSVVAQDGTLQNQKYECDHKHPDARPVLLSNCDATCDVCKDKKELSVDGAWFSNNVTQYRYQWATTFECPDFCRFKFYPNDDCHKADHQDELIEVFPTETCVSRPLFEGLQSFRYQFHRKE